MIFKELKIPGAGTWSRDCELISIDVPNMPFFSMDYYKDSDNSYWRMKFGRVIAYKIISEEFTRFGYLWDLPRECEYYFYEIEDSPWLNEFQSEFNKHLVDQFKHYVFRMYDETVEVLSDRLEVEKLEKSDIVE